MAQVAQPSDNSSLNAFAEDEAFDEILVTARRRSESLQAVPVATSVIDSETISAAGTFAPAQLGQVATGLIVTPFNGDRSNIILTIRGQAYVTGTLFPAVVPYFAEVPMIKLTTGTFFDLENVQVLRGPQGTLFGRVTDGGNVMIQPHRPTNQLEGYAEIKVGNFDLRAAEGALNIPVIDDKLLVRAAFEINRRDGYSRNLAGRRFDDISYESARLSVIARPTDSFENYTVFTYNHADEKGGSPVLQEVNRPAVVASVAPLLGPAGAGALADRLQAELAAQRQRSPYINNADTPGLDKRRQVALLNTSTLEISDNLTAKLILGYMRYKQRVQYDADGTSEPYTAVIALLPTPLNNQEQISGEFQLQGKGLGNKLNWTLGTYWDQQKTGSPSETYFISFNAVTRSTVQDITTRSKAVYAQASYEFLPGLTAEGGVRYTEDTSRANTAVYVSFLGPTDVIPHGQCLATLPTGLLPGSAPCTASSATFDATTYLASLQWQATDDVFLYAKFSKGYRPGGFDASGVAGAYGPERLYSKEIGAKTEFDLGDVAVRLNVAGFWDEFKDLQRFTLVGASGGSVTAVTNAAAATIKGIEVEATVLPIPELRLGLNYSYLDAEYDTSAYTADEIARACPADPLTQVPDTSIFCPLSPFARTPEHMFTFTARYTVPADPSFGNLSIGGSWYYTDGAWSTATSYINPGSFIPSYSVVNADITWRSVVGSNFDASLFATNLLDEQYQVSESSSVYFGGSGLAFGQYGEPQMYGARIRYNF